MRALCSNPWCKATFIYTDLDMIIKEDKLNKIIKKFPPKTCNSCRNTANYLTDGVEWNDREETDNTGGSFNEPQEMQYKITNFR